MFRSIMQTAFAAALAFAPLTAAKAGDFSSQQKSEIGEIVKGYLLEHPEVLRDALDALDKKEKLVAADALKTAVKDEAATIFLSKNQANFGNPAGSATLVEFFDYNCHYCKNALPDMVKLMHDDPNLKVVLKDFPVLGPGSVEAARIAVAVRNQLSGDKMWQFHQQLLNSHGKVGKTEALAVAKGLGVDMEKLAKDMEKPEVQTGLEEIVRLADKLTINGTPSFVVGDEVVVGAVGFDSLKTKIDNVHKCGKATC